jgi:Protein kinase domain
MVGQTLGQYRVIRSLGEGAMGEVYHAIDELLERDVALKLLRPELAHRQDLVARFRIEATTLARLDHPNITRLLGLVRHDPHLFMVMEYVDGETLSGLTQRGGPLRWREAAARVGEILDALEYAHGAGVVHRDIKPANIIIRRDGRVKVTDFGIARVVGSARRTREGHIIGTLDYMAPEQIRGEEATASADLYSTGALLYEVLTGSTPFSGTTDYELMQRHIHDPVPPLAPLGSDIPAWFDPLIERAMAKTPGERFASAGEFRSELARLAASEPLPAIKATRLAAAPATGAIPATRLGPRLSEEAAPPARPAPPPAPAPPPITWRLWAGGAGAVVVFLGVVFGINLLRSRPAAQPTTPGGSNGSVAHQTVAQPPATVPVTPDPPPEPPRVLDLDRAAAQPQVPSRREGPRPDPVGPPKDGVVPSERVADPRGTPADLEERREPSIPSTPAAAPRVPGASAGVREFEGITFIAGGREEEDAVLAFGETGLVVKDEDAKVLRTMPYSSVRRATYSQTTRRRLKFIKSTQRSLTLQLSGVVVVLRLPSENAEAILTQLERRTGLAVIRER